jgi:hypothetical protein
VPMTMNAPMDEGTVMDMVRNPMCTEYPKGMDCFKDNRATLHLHGGVTLDQRLLRTSGLPRQMRRQAGPRESACRTCLTWSVLTSPPACPTVLQRTTAA